MNMLNPSTYRKNVSKKLGKIDMKKSLAAQIFEAEEKLLRSTKDEKVIKGINKARQHRKISKIGIWIIGIDLLIQLCLWEVGVQPIAEMRYIHYLICITVPCLSIYFYWYARNEYKKLPSGYREKLEEHRKLGLL